jgi:hypothetical protein
VAFDATIPRVARRRIEEGPRRPSMKFRRLRGLGEKPRQKQESRDPFPDSRDD